MDFHFAKEDEAFRKDIDEFVSSHLPWDWQSKTVNPENPSDAVLVKQFRRLLAEKGWLTMAWPIEYGGQSASYIRQMIFSEEMAYREIPANDPGVRMVGPILMLHGSDQQKADLLPSIANADITWSQGYSEPDAGSDLASLQTSATDNGDDFVVNGSKIWNSAHEGSDWMFMMARTSQDMPKHKGISFLLTEMNVEGIKIEKIPMMWNAYRGLVTFNNVRIPKKNLVGALNQGWYVGASLLDFERSGVDRPARAQRVLEELTQFCKWTRWQGHYLAEDSLIRARLSNAAIEIEASRIMCYNVAWMQSHGLIPNKEASIAKVFGSEMIVRTYQLAMKILGQYGQLEPGSERAPMAGRIENAFLRSLGGTVAAGTSEIQRNIISTRGLGLPRG